MIAHAPACSRLPGAVMVQRCSGGSVLVCLWFDGENGACGVVIRHADPVRAGRRVSGGAAWSVHLVAFVTLEGEWCLRRRSVIDSTALGHADSVFRGDSA